MGKSRSLRAQLLLWLLVPLALVAVFDISTAHRSAQQTAGIVQDRMLLGAARIIGEQVRVEEGVLQVVVPPAALELFASPSRDRVFYRATAGGDLLLTGYYDLPLPARRPRPEEVGYFDAQLRGRTVRVAAYAQPVLASPAHGTVLIEVAQTTEGRDALARDIWVASLRRHLVLVALVGVLLWFGLRRALRPMLALRDRVRELQPGSVQTLDVGAAPSELQPLVAAFNDYAQRLQGHLTAQSRFIADASHQLRTPLTLLNTQVSYALRHRDEPGRDDALHAIQDSVHHGMRLVKQLLTFTTAEAGAPASVPQPVDLVELVTELLEREAWLAQARAIDLGFESCCRQAVVRGHPQLLAEIAANLIDNALRYTPAGGRVTVALLDQGAEGIDLVVEDTGPGIAAADRERVFERFCRLQNTVSDGCGLGLSIVREIARSHGAAVTLHDALAAPTGLRAQVRFPALAAAPIG